MNMTSSTPMTPDIPTLRRQLEQLRELHEAGVLPATQYEEGKVALERRIVDLVMSGAVDQPAAAPAEHAQAAGPAGKKEHGLSRGLVAALGGGVLVLAVAGYWWMGSPEQLAVGPGSTGGSSMAGTGPAGANGGAAPHDTSQAQIADMVERLSARMKDSPEDAEGWAMLGRSYSVLGRHPEALAAYEKAVKLRKDDAQLLADYADSLAVKNDRQLAGEPMKWVEAALKLEPGNFKALALAGTDAFDRKDYATAVKHWSKLVESAPPDNSFAQQILGGLSEARQLAGMPALPAAAPAPMALPGASVSGSITLAPGLAGKAAPDDTLFVFARAADGAQRMPLAILRRQVKDLPLSFTLDDSSSMSPAARISAVKSVIVSARISKSGQATPAPGDLTGQSAAVDVGATGIAIEIREEVK
ncbi:MAG: tetratricopeptide repeat protein [Hydrogenophaga sp.]|uniref:c-type cytochrome biogenesis protein CcmI/CycH n=1 Tax=Hydrogenophaga sp. TaxID=1904254 RepID=UPI00271ED90D|nr:tetratricopeptide repeat protein [Hydrogenophaga sp.]MDO9029218.1 tetratricopeptide repeat protein [Hydrogenophaga sp.]